MLGGAQFFGDFFIGHVVAAAHIEDTPHVIGKGFDLFFDERGKVFFAQEVIGLGLVCYGKGRQVVDIFLAGLFTGDLLEDTVARGGIEVAFERTGDV